jgi:hypothetical protein
VLILRLAQAPYKALPTPAGHCHQGRHMTAAELVPGNHGKVTTIHKTRLGA